MDTVLREIRVCDACGALVVAEMEAVHAEQHLRSEEHRNARFRMHEFRQWLRERGLWPR